MANLALRDQVLQMTLSGGANAADKRRTDEMEVGRIDDAEKAQVDTVKLRRLLESAKLPWCIDRSRRPDARATRDGRA